MLSHKSLKFSAYWRAPVLPGLQMALANIDSPDNTVVLVGLFIRVNGRR